MHVHVVGRKNSGKTQFCALLIAYLTEIRGMRVAVVKHSSHAHPAEDEDRDTGKLRRAGAAVSVFESKQDLALVCSSGDLLAQSIVDKAISSCDIVVREGDHRRLGPKIEIIPRGGWRNSFLATKEAKDIVAVICDEEIPASLPRFGSEAVAHLVDWLEKKGD